MKQVTAAIIVNSNKTLIARRALNEKLAGFWEFPGGKLEVGETLKACIEREILEELGVKSFAGEEFARSIYRYEHGEIELIAIFIEILSYDFQLSVHDQVSWASPEDLLTYQLAPADIPIAEELIEWITIKSKL